MNSIFIMITINISNFCCFCIYEYFKRKLILYFHRALPIINYMFEYHSFSSNSTIRIDEYFTVLK